MSQGIATLQTGAGHTLHCIWHPPEGPRTSARKMACLLLSPGVKMRVAPHRLYSKLAESLTSRGIGVLRVDFHGMGDSSGELDDVALDQLYRQVQSGRHVGDVTAALDWLQREQGISRVIAGGLCGGAITGLLAAEADERIVGLYAIGIPVTLDGPSEQSAAYMTRTELGTMRRTYLRKLVNPGAWLRVLTFRSDFRLMFRSFTTFLQRFRPARAGRADEHVPAPATAPAANFNPGFARAYFRLLRRGAPALLIFSGSDRLWAEYQEKFAEPWAAHLAAHEAQVTTHLVPRANHVLGDARWVAEARKATEDWLDARFP